MDCAGRGKAGGASRQRGCGNVFSLFEPAQVGAGGSHSDASASGTGAPSISAQAAVAAAGGSGSIGRAHARRGTVTERQLYTERKLALETTRKRSGSLPTRSGNADPLHPDKWVPLTKKTGGSSRRASVDTDHATLSAAGSDMKDEVDLSIGVLERTLEQCHEHELLPAERLQSTVTNVLRLLKRFKADMVASAARRESQWKQALSRGLILRRPDMLMADDQEVAQFVSEFVFNPAELRRFESAQITDSLEESAQHFFRETGTEVSSRRSLTFSSGPSSGSLTNTPAGADDDSAGHKKSASMSASGVEVSVSMLPDESKASDYGVEQIALVDALLARSEVDTVLAAVDHWNLFDPFRLDLATDHRPLITIMSHLFTTLGLFERYNVDRRRFVNFYQRVEDRYLDNPYHNAVHAADVVQNVFVFIRTNSFSQQISAVDVMAALVAASVHDLRHPGTTNGFQVASCSKLAVQYNDRSVLENYHLAEAFKLLRDPQCDIFQGLSAELRKEVRESIISMVLATDMAEHMRIMSQVETAIQRHQEADTWFSNDTSSRADALLLLQCALHCADVSNPCKPLPLYRQWVERLTQEWYAQGDKEKELGLPVSAMMDRNKPNVAKSQVGFIDYFIEPLFKTWCRVVPEAEQRCMDNLKANRAHYASLQK